jgi:hypothetical protein
VTRTDRRPRTGRDDFPARAGRTSSLLAPLLPLLFLVVGCGSSADGYERFPVEGVVTLDGKDLDSGTINFITTQAGPSETSEIDGGRFRLSKSRGLSPGTYRVEVYCVKPTGKKIPDPDNPPQLIDETTNIVPMRYNVNSTLMAEIPSGGPSQPLSFALSTKKKGR